MEKKSMFFKGRFERDFPVSFLLLEAISFLIAQESADEIERSFTEVVTRALIDCGVRADGEVSEDDVVYVSLRLQQIEKEAESEEGEKGTDSKKPGFAVEYSQWVSGLTVEETCLYAADYDFAASEEYYCSVDKDDVLKIARCRMKRDWESIRMGFESAMYGFGGSYGEGGKEGEKVHDLTESSVDGMKALSKMFNKA